MSTYQPYTCVEDDNDFCSRIKLPYISMKTQTEIATIFDHHKHGFILPMAK